MNFENTIPYEYRSYFGFMKKDERYLKSIVYKKDEIFKHHPWLPLVIGNMGTVINELLFGFKMIPKIDTNGHLSISYTSINTDGSRTSHHYKIANLIMETFVPGFTTKTMKVVYVDGNKLNLLYLPNSKENNLIPLTQSEFMKWRMANDPNMGHKRKGK